VLRRALSASVFFNLGGALAFAFPGSVGRLVGLPAPVPPLYAFSMAFLVALFAGTYAWLARQPEIDRPMVAFFALGKAGFFLVTFACWLGGAASTLFVLAATGDLVFAVIFAWCLLAAPDPSTAAARARAA